MRRDDPQAAALLPSTPLIASAHIVLAALRPLLTEERVARIDTVVGRRMRSVVPVLDALSGPHNVAAILRSADAFGVQEVHLLEGPQDFLASRRVTQGAERWLDVVHHANPHACVATLRARGFQVYVATMEGSITPEALCHVPRLAVVFGNEHKGVGTALTALCDGHYTIPMQGFSQSLNVSVAAAITLYHATRGRKPDLSDEERDELRARFMMLSVPRAADVVAEYVGRHGE